MMSSNVEPFPVRRCRHYLDMMRTQIEAQPSTAKKRTMLWKIVEQHRAFLASAGVAKELIDREVRDLVQAISTPLTPDSGLRMAA
jgi:hypothetical protein